MNKWIKAPVRSFQLVMKQTDEEYTDVSKPLTYNYILHLLLLLQGDLGPVSTSCVLRAELKEGVYKKVF